MPELSDIRFKAVLVGAVVDTAATLLIMMLLASLLASKGLSDNEIMARLTSTSGLLLGLIIGLGCTVLGGYLAGRIAGRAEVLHGALVAAVGVVLSIIFWDSGDPLWFNIAGIAAVLPAGMAGGRLAQKRRGPANDRPPK